MAQLLPMEENFLLLFRFHNPLESSVEFMKVGSSSNVTQNFADENRRSGFESVMIYDAPEENFVINIFLCQCHVSGVSSAAFLSYPSLRW